MYILNKARGLVILGLVTPGAYRLEAALEIAAAIGAAFMAAVVPGGTVEREFLLFNYFLVWTCDIYQAAAVEKRNGVGIALMKLCVST